MTAHVAQCNGTIEDCFPQVLWIADFLNNVNTKKTLGIAEHLDFRTVNEAIHAEFEPAGDL